jgi:ferritin-like metal-binding protein YciE
MACRVTGILLDILLIQSGSRIYFERQAQAIKGPWPVPCILGAMPKIQSLQEVFVNQLKDLYSAETQLIKALSKMAKAAAAPDLKKGFLLHLEETKIHAERIKKICESIKEKPAGKKCEATAGLVKEGGEAIEDNALPEMKDVMLIAAGQRVEHYEIAAYTSAIALAKSLGLNEAAQNLSQTLSEEIATDAKLTKALGGAISSAKIASA